MAGGALDRALNEVPVGPALGDAAVGPAPGEAAVARIWGEPGEVGRGCVVSGAWDAWRDGQEDRT